jgi:hypothetical protein
MPEMVKSIAFPGHSYFNSLLGLWIKSPRIRNTDSELTPAQTAQANPQPTATSAERQREGAVGGVLVGDAVTAWLVE